MTYLNGSIFLCVAYARSLITKKCPATPHQIPMEIVQTKNALFALNQQWPQNALPTRTHTHTHFRPVAVYVCASLFPVCESTLVLFCLCVFFFFFFSTTVWLQYSLYNESNSMSRTVGKHVARNRKRSGERERGREENKHFELDKTSNNIGKQ